MNEIKFLHCADIHLDAPFTSLGIDPGKSAIRRQDLKDTFQRIIHLAKSENVDLLLVCGDLYEHEYIKKSTISFINDMFNEISRVDIFIVPGNHDPYVANSFYRSNMWPQNVHILTSDKPYHILQNRNVCLHGIGFKSFSEEKSLIQGLKPADNKFINILLMHGTVDMGIGQSTYNPMSVDELSALGMDYIALGHFHNRIDNIGAKGVIFNPGSPEPLGFDEPGEHGVLVGTIRKQIPEKSFLETRFVSLNQRQYICMDIAVDGCSNNGQVLSRITDAIEKLSTAAKADSNRYPQDFHFDNVNLLVDITLKGYLDRDFKIDVFNLIDNLKNRVFHLKIKDDTKPDYNFEEIMKEPGLRGLYVRKMYERINAAQDEKQKLIYTKALYYGMDALECGKVEIPCT